MSTPVLSLKVHCHFQRSLSKSKTHFPKNPTLWLPVTSCNPCSLYRELLGPTQYNLEEHPFWEFTPAYSIGRRVQRRRPPRVAMQDLISTVSLNCFKFVCKNWSLTFEHRDIILFDNSHQYFFTQTASRDGRRSSALRYSNYRESGSARCCAL